MRDRRGYRHVRRALAREAGYTMIELLVTGAIVVIGFTLVLFLQVKTIQGTGNAERMTEAVNLAEHLMETIRTEALMWTNATTQSWDQVGFKYLDNVGAPGGTGSGWLRAYYVPGDGYALVGPNGRDDDPVQGYDPGLLLDTDVDSTLKKKFCVHYRLTWIIDDYLIRVETRVMWPTGDGSWESYWACPTNAGMAEDLANVNQVSVASAVMRNVFVPQ